MLVNYKKIASVALCTVILGSSMMAGDKDLVSSRKKLTHTVKIRQRPEVDDAKKILVQPLFDGQTDGHVISAALRAQLPNAKPDAITTLAEYILKQPKYNKLRVDATSNYQRAMQLRKTDTIINFSKNDSQEELEVEDGQAIVAIEELVLPEDTLAPLIDNIVTQPVSKILKDEIVDYISTALNLTGQRKISFIKAITKEMNNRRMDQNETEEQRTNLYDSGLIISCLTDIEKISLIANLAEFMEPKMRGGWFNRTFTVNEQAITAQSVIDHLTALSPVINNQLQKEFAHIEKIVKEKGKSAKSFQDKAKKNARWQRAKFFIASLLGTAAFAYYVSCAKDKLLSNAARLGTLICFGYTAGFGFSFFNEPESEHYDSATMSALFKNAFSIVFAAAPEEAKENAEAAKEDKGKETGDNDEDSIPDLIEPGEGVIVNLSNSVGSDF